MEFLYPTASPTAPGFSNGGYLILGLIPLLGAASLQQAFGRLVHSPFAEFFPTLADYIFASNAFAEPIPGFALYNITEGVRATELSAWFTRWLLSQNFTNSSTCLHFEDAPARPHYLGRSCTLIASILVYGYLSAFAFHVGDFYGYFSVSALIVCMLVRQSILRACRDSLNEHMENAGKGSQAQSAKLFVTLPTGQAVAIEATRGIFVQCFLTEAKPTGRKLHLLMRGLGWLAFASHVVLLALATEPMQLVSISTMVLFSVLAIHRVGCNEHRIGNRLYVTRYDFPGIESRAKAYVMLDLDEIEEQDMVAWFVMPRRSNTIWWDTYKTFKAEAKSEPAVLNTWGQRLDAAYALLEGGEITI
ncbi:hypothetical protein BDV95DRAFT_605498 [Massariosphaeria phaeospora]|uniref:Uncharacterized protein n=1 Tax=Massariosphaeria phaeospora TaxID=100035 RepID=A0A7C8IHA7_9PLEO|nr:hypothetical protein BDV95DRAFT_605498 [Massariosphaeria phaeospora]